LPEGECGGEGEVLEEGDGVGEFSFLRSLVSSSFSLSSSSQSLSRRGNRTSVSLGEALPARELTTGGAEIGGPLATPSPRSSSLSEILLLVLGLIP